MVYDVNMDLSHKGRFVVGGHVTDPITFILYSGIVVQDSL
jgi:hypothetical protein